MSRTAGLSGTLGVGVISASSTTGYPAPGLVGGVEAYRSVDLTDVPSSEMMTAWTPVSVDMTSAMITLEAGKQYAITVSSASGGSPPWVLWASRDTNPYSGGMMFNDPRTSANRVYSPTSQYDAAFNVLVDPTKRVATGSVTLSPAYDVLATGTSGGYTLTDGEFAINTQQYAPANIDRRALLGFDLTSIPDGAEIVGATLTLDVQAYTDSNELTTLQLYGFSDDGKADAADATRIDEALALARWRGEPSDPLVFSFGTAHLAALERLLEASDHVGLSLHGPSHGNQLGFWTSESAGFSTPPSLSVSYRYITSVPEPATASIATCILLALLRRGPGRCV